MKNRRKSAKTTKVNVHMIFQLFQRLIQKGYVCDGTFGLAAYFSSRRRLYGKWRTKTYNVHFFGFFDIFGVPGRALQAGKLVGEFLRAKDKIKFLNEERQFYKDRIGEVKREIKQRNIENIRLTLAR